MSSAKLKLVTRNAACRRSAPRRRRSRPDPRQLWLPLPEPLPATWQPLGAITAGIVDRLAAARVRTTGVRA